MKVYFYLLQPKSSNKPHQHYIDASRALYKPQLLSLAEGLKEKHIEFAANINWWIQEDDTYLFRKTSESPTSHSHKYDIVVLGSEVFKYPNKIPKWFNDKRLQKKIVVYDWVASLFFSPLIQKRIPKIKTYFYYSYSNFILECTNNPNVSPWPIGLTNRIIDYTNKFYKPFSTRKNYIFYSHRNSHPIRNIVFNELYKKLPTNMLTIYNDNFKRNITPQEKLNPHEETKFQNNYDKLLWYQTGRRHNIHFYKEMCNSQIVDCCGGYFYSKSTNANAQHTQKIGKIIRNWDNYKLWEAFAAGCCVITLDMDYYGFELPAIPINGVHYIGIQLNKLDETKNKLQNNEFDVEKNSKGRQRMGINILQSNKYGRTLI